MPSPKKGRRGIAKAKAMEARLSPCGEGTFCFDMKEFISWLVGCFLFSICIGFVFCFAFLGPPPLTEKKAEIFYLLLAGEDLHQTLLAYKRPVQGLLVI